VRTERNTLRHCVGEMKAYWTLKRVVRIVTTGV